MSYDLTICAQFSRLPVLSHDKPTNTPNMLFCETCLQPLCQSCKAAVHSTKMFATHVVVPISNVLRNKQHMCDVHNEPRVMFSSVHSRLLCIKCFNALENSDRYQCVDIETAYHSSCDLLSQSYKSLQQLLQSFREATTSITKMIKELHTNAEKEKEEIETLYQSLMETLEQEKLALLETVEKVKESKEAAFNEQVETLRETVPQIESHISTCQDFTETASKYELLHLCQDVRVHLKWLQHQPYQLAPVDDCQLDTNMKEEFARCLQPLLMDNCTGVSPLLVMPRVDFFVSQILSTADGRGRNSPAGFTSCTSPVNGHGSQGRRVSWNVGTAAIQGDGPFVEHCRNFNPILKSLQQHMNQMKEKVQDLHQDLTRRRCQPRRLQLSEVQCECKTLETTLSLHCTTLEQLRSPCEKGWSSALSRVALEQDIYQAQVCEVHKLQQENLRLATIVDSIQPFFKSLTAVAERNDSHLKQAAQDRSQEDQMTSLLGQITDIHPNSKQRIDAIESIKRPGTKGNSALEDTLVKTRGLLKARKAKPDEPS
ncbi:RING finger protein 207-like isoform X2 [Corticium candelabrum]|uniref:RING finger protein 207-like isoform X2 n=1 Tax=Corticium candelabrum TaxID=121492 RepID=UPI002E276F2B|nr:RING finger protein 207-like isoform X2 [Corticium candelabrum]